MNDFQLQTEINGFMQREIDSYAEKRKLELEIEGQNTVIKKRFEKNFTIFGVIILVNALISFAFNSTFDYFFLFIFGFLSSIEFGLLYINLHQKQKKLEIFKNDTLQLNES